MADAADAADAAATGGREDVAKLIRKTTLANGVRVLTERIEHVRSVSMGVWVDVGSRDESLELAGVSHMIEHMIFKGTEQRSALDIALEIDAIGAMSNAFTSREQTCFYAKVLDTHAEEMVDLLADIFLHSTFDPQELNRERKVILQEIKMVEDTPDDQVHTLMPTVLWPGDPLGRPILGRVETVGSLSQDQLRAYLRRTYTPERIVIAACGLVDHDRLIEMLEPTFGSLNGSRNPDRPDAPRCGNERRLIDRDLEQVHVCLGAGAPSIVEEDRYPAAILNVILGGSMSSRLFQEVREKRGLAYAVYSYMAAYSNAGYMGVYMGVDPRRCAEAMAVVLDVMGGLGNNGITSDDLYKAKEHLKGQIFLAAESTDNRMQRLARNEYHFGRDISFDEVARNIDEVKAGDISRVAAGILDPTRLAMVALGPDVSKTLDGTINGG